MTDFSSRTGRRKQQLSPNKGQRTSSEQRRTKPQASEAELYKQNIKKFIVNERRHDELDRLREVKEQKKMWRNTMIACGILNIIFIFLGVMGYIGGIK